MRQVNNIIVAGSGAFGTALACVLAQNSNDQITLLTRHHESAERILKERQNTQRLPNIKLPETLNITADINNLNNADIILCVVPSNAQSNFLQKANDHISRNSQFVICSKGFDKATGDLITTKLHAIRPDLKLSVLSGPGFAADIAKGLPTAMTLASPTIENANSVSQILSRKNFRLYSSNDIIGVQTGGALKNVLAIASGIVIGAKLGESARASLLARGLAELSRFITARGGKIETASGLSGLGDLILTATSEQSRNYNFGLKLGQGAMMEQLLGPDQPLVEGANAAIATAKVAHTEGINLPVTNSIADIILSKINVSQAVEQLLARPLRQETEHH